MSHRYFNQVPCHLSPAEQLIEWIRACDELHGEHCQATPMAARSKEQIPRWVIDTEQACIVPGRTVPRYAALSYVWPEQGASGDRLMLERSNIEALQKPGVLASGSLSRLPLVIRQTIGLLKDVQERYLWVDCLCIVQHDGETQTQAYSMNEIYSGAYFTIIAAALEGLLGTKDSAYSYFHDHVHDLVTTESHYEALMSSRWATRGWTFQEQILSKRAIIFLNPYRDRALAARMKANNIHQPEEPIRANILWDCQCALWDGKQLQPATNTVLSETRPLEVENNKKGTNTSPLSLNDTAWPKFRSYLESVCLYSNRNLTYPQDILAAFSGVLTELGRSFPGGFVQGLPHCFIDETLIWQPFSTAVKRRNIINDGIAPYRYLPSWSWCSWRCPIDPYSLATGLQYSADPDSHMRQRSWRTKPLVEWSIVSTDQSLKVPLTEAAMQHKWNKLASNSTSWDADGWTIHYTPPNEEEESIYFTHASSGSQRTCFPLPVRGGSSLSPEQMALPYLSCVTRRAWFTVCDFLHCHDHGGVRASIKTSVFDLPQFKDGPVFEDACSIVALEDGAGEWVGVLRVMDRDHIRPGREVELIAISRGEASYADVVRAFEERVDFLRMFEYKEGKKWLIWAVTTRAGKWQRYVLSPHCTMVDPAAAQSRPQDLVDAFNKSQSSPQDAPIKGTYHFYNVMWIEWEDGIAYRRAVGRIRKEAWERYCSEPIKIVLG